VNRLAVIGSTESMAVTADASTPMLARGVFCVVSVLASDTLEIIRKVRDVPKLERLTLEELGGAIDSLVVVTMFPYI
jgi:hypothetical protein